MVRFNATQSVWKNSEDEILKAAVMKYGLNQWGRVASLFAKRTAKQCKARWDEWLDPTIKKTEWSREEDEKLLHLAKLMPTQWRTIAPLVGRTAAQCLERYERLLDAVSGGQDLDAIHAEEEGAGDAAEGEEEEEGAPGGATALKKKRVAAAETLPAKPDAVDMDEEELEMLSEARARLANTLGKKAKRKARERQLEEQKRIALLQKRRELKAAGISTGKLTVVNNNKRRRKNSDAEQIDYTEDVPFEQLAPKGPYDVKNEKLESFRRERDEKARIEKLAKAQEQQKEKEHQKKKKKTSMSVKDLEAKLAAERRKNEEALAVARSARPALSLPAPQISDAELEDVAKASLLNLGPSSTSSSFVVPSLPASRRRDEIITQEARNQLARDREGSASVTRTEGTGFEGAQPLQQQQNVKRGLASLASRRTFAGANGRVVVLRDDLGLNKDIQQPGQGVDEESFLEDAEQLAKGRSLELKHSLSNLPAPEYEYSVQVKQPSKKADEDDEDDENEQKRRGTDQNEDARLKDRKKQRLMQEKNERMHELLPTAVKLGLPEIPPLPSSAVPEEADPARRMILEEMYRGLVNGDSRSVPMNACKELEELALVKLDLEDVRDLFAEVDQQPVWTVFPPAELFALAKNAASKVAKESQEIRKLAEAAIQDEKDKAPIERVMTLFKQTKKALSERELYTWMKQVEDRAAETRLEQLKREVEDLAQRERAMQQLWVEKAV